MKHAVQSVLLLCGAGLGACASSHAAGAESLSSAERAELLAVREEVWRAWFRGDEASLGRLLTPDFLAFEPSGPLAPGRERQLEGARAFRESGGKLLALEFPATEIQLLGDVAVIYTTYVVELEDPSGRNRLSGRATEVFRRVGGRWVHPGWHMDGHE
jgi:ketosteroid isomerase-like protein